MLDPNVFLEQMNRLKVLPVQGGFEGPDEFAWRKVVYFEALQGLDTGQFVSACAALMKESGRVYFPTPGEIIREGEAWQPAPANALPAPRSPEQVEEERARGRENARAGMEIIRKELRDRGLLPPGEPVASMPKVEP